MTQLNTASAVSDVKLGDFSPLTAVVPALDEFGRDASERTIELSPRDAEAIDQEVVQGRHQTYDNALHYVINRGLAEIKRVRDAARVQAEKTVLKQKKDGYQRLMQQNPALITNSDFVTTMLADLGLVANATQKSK
jgi:hypothetical protein